jgi:hypothetical protein
VHKQVYTTLNVEAKTNNAFQTFDMTSKNVGLAFPQENLAIISGFG